MSALDYLVLLGTIGGIALYGLWKTRGKKNLRGYLKGKQDTHWATIGLAVMATQASAITFLSTPGQGFESGLGFVQNYFGLPIALIIVATIFLPIYRRLNVYTAYEYLGRRFDAKTRLLGAGLFLLQRGLAASITIYAPAIVISTVAGWPLDVTILLSGSLAIFYTVSGGSEAVNITQKHQMAVILIGLVAVFVILLVRMPHGLTLPDTLRVAGGFGKMQAVDFSLDTHKRYTLWSGILGGVFLSLSYFGTDQSQVQRYLSGGSLRASKLGLMFNAVLKIPMQFFILLLGVLVFVFYQFDKPPLFFNQTEWRAHAQGADGEKFRALEAQFAVAHAEKSTRIQEWLAAKKSGDTTAEITAHSAMIAAQAQTQQLREDAKAALLAANPNAKTTDSDYVFITFVTDHLPHGIIGLLFAVIFAGGLSSTSAELNALGSTTMVDFYRHVGRKDATDAHYVIASKWFTAMWGAIAVGFALFANLVENLIQAVNILGSIFYGVALGIFLVAFFLKRIGGSGVFWGALAAQALVLALYFLRHTFAGLNFSYLWYNLIGCAACVIFSLVLNNMFKQNAKPSAPSPT